MRLLLIHDGVPEPAPLERSLAQRAEIRSFRSLSDALLELPRLGWRADAAVVELPGDMAPDFLLLYRLREMIAPAPLVLGMAGLSAVIDQLALAAPGPQRLGRPPTGLAAAVEHLAEQQRLLSQSIAAQRGDIKAEIERVAAAVAEAVVGRAVDRLAERLGVEDAEGLRLAVRLARGWEQAKIKFFSALATGLASAFLLALGAGIAAMIRSSSTK